MSAAADLTRNQLAKKIAEEVKAADVTHGELLEHSRTAGELLIEAARRYPKAKDFDAFLKDAGGLGRSRAYELMAVVGGRKTIEQVKAATRERVKKHRAKKKLLPPPSVTVTDNPTPTSTDEPEPDTPEPTAEPEVIPFDASHRTSTRALAEFKHACDTWLPQMTNTDLDDAFGYALHERWRIKEAS